MHGYTLRCLSCSSIVCCRASRSVLVSNMQIRVFSSNHPLHAKCIGSAYIAHSCQCMIADVGCGCCRVVLGYHVLHPCAFCLKSRNNGHLWMFDIGSVCSAQRPRTEVDYVLEHDEVRIR